MKFTKTFSFYFFARYLQTQVVTLHRDFKIEYKPNLNILYYEGT